METRYRKTRKGEFTHNASHFPPVSGSLPTPKNDQDEILHVLVPLLVLLNLKIVGIKLPVGDFPDKRSIDDFTHTGMAGEGDKFNLPQACPEKGKSKSHPRLKLFMGIAAGAAAFVAAVPLVTTAMGFTAGGIAAGSTAAGM